MKILLKKISSVKNESLSIGFKMSVDKIQKLSVIFNFKNKMAKVFGMDYAIGKVSQWMSDLISSAGHGVETVFYMICCKWHWPVFESLKLRLMLSFTTLGKFKLLQRTQVSLDWPYRNERWGCFPFFTRRGVVLGLCFSSCACCISVFDSVSLCVLPGLTVCFCCFSCVQTVIVSVEM